MKTNAKRLITSFLLIFLIVGAYLYVNNDSTCNETYPNGECLPEGMCITPTDGVASCDYVDASRATDEEILLNLNCDRITADVIGTDYYCGHLDLYRSDLEDGNLLDENWSTAHEQLRERGLIE